MATEPLAPPALAGQLKRVESPLASSSMSTLPVGFGLWLMEMSPLDAGTDVGVGFVQGSMEEKEGVRLRWRRKGPPRPSEVGPGGLGCRRKGEELARVRAVSSAGPVAAPSVLIWRVAASIASDRSAGHHTLSMSAGKVVCHTANSREQSDIAPNPLYARTGRVLSKIVGELLTAGSSLTARCAGSPSANVTIVLPLLAINKRTTTSGDILSER